MSSHNYDRPNGCRSETCVSVSPLAKFQRKSDLEKRIAPPSDDLKAKKVQLCVLKDGGHPLGINDSEIKATFDVCKKSDNQPPNRFVLAEKQFQILRPQANFPQRLLAEFSV